MYRKVLAAALALFGLTLFPILRADRFYIDDLGRSLHGYLGWGMDARPLANVVMETLNLGTPLVDLSPIPQIAAGLLFAWLAVSVAKRFGLEGAWRAPLAVLPLFASPLYLENLSYKFDVLTMSLAVCLAAWSALARPLPRANVVFGAVGLVAVLCLYQPAISVFAIFAVLEVAVQQLRDERFTEILRAAALRVLQYVVALGIYRLTVARNAKGAYATAHAAMATGTSMLSTIGTDLRIFTHYAFGALRTAGGPALIALIALGLLCTSACALSYARRQWQDLAVWQRITQLVLVPLLPAVAFLAIWGPMLLLQNPVVAPRTQIGVGALGAASAILLLAVMQRVRIPASWQIGALAIVAYPMIAFATVYGNTLAQQKEYEDGLSRALADDLNDLADSDGVARWALLGNAGMPPVAMHNAAKYPFLTQLVPVHLTQRWGWASDMLEHAGLALPRVRGDEVDVQAIRQCSIAPVNIRVAYRIYVMGNTAVVQFGRPVSCHS